MKRMLELRRMLNDGFAIIRAVAGADVIAEMLRICASFDAELARGRGGVRSPLARSPELAASVERTGVLELARRILGTDAQLVRTILFDKSPASNWLVPWHQDKTIAVAERIDVAGYGPWSVKDGVPHVQPRAEVLERMVTLRLHLDDCGSDNGPLVVLPGSHRYGILDEATQCRFLEEREPTTCTCSTGDAVIMRPLLLHKSAKADSPSRRRVLHMEFAGGGLDGGLRWAVGG